MQNLPAIPGFVGFTDSLSSRAAALSENDVPLTWTPEHVGKRLVDAFDVLSRSGTRTGPRQYGNGWPAMVHEFADLVDAQARAQVEKEKQQARAALPTAEELSMMNQALAWPSRYLDGQMLKADSLMLWAYAVALDRDMAAMLHHRKKRATALAKQMARLRNADPGPGDTRDIVMQWRAALRRQIAREVAASVPAADAQAELRRRLEAANCMPYRFQPHEAMPGRALSRTNLDRQRKLATGIVAAGLRRDGIAVR